jgi:hypothetical protein
MHELIIESVSPLNYKGDSEYVWLYGAPSALMHGDPEGIQFIFQQDGNGTNTARMRVSDEELNAMIVDAGANALMFCGAFLECFHPDNEEFKKRIAELDTDFKALTLLHPYGRNEEPLKRLRLELEERGVNFKSHVFLLS